MAVIFYCDNNSAMAVIVCCDKHGAMAAIVYCDNKSQNAPVPYPSMHHFVAPRVRTFCYKIVNFWIYV